MGVKWVSRARPAASVLISVVHLCFRVRHIGQLVQEVVVADARVVPVGTANE